MSDGFEEGSIDDVGMVDGSDCGLDVGADEG